MPVQGADLVSKNIALFGGKFLEEVNKDMETARLVLDKAIEKNITLSDHTLADLKAMGHPYARRSPQSIHDPKYQVHKQSGKMLEGKYSGTKKASVSLFGNLEAQAYVGIKDDVEHAFHVVFGTSKMIPRDFLIGSLGEVREQLWNTLKRSLKNAVISFNGKTEKL